MAGYSRWWAALLVFVSVIAGAVNAVPGEGGDYLTETWTAEDGLPNSAVTSLLQTREGYLWIGTSNGLARFDGLRFVNFRKGESGGLLASRVLALFESRDGLLWVGTEGGGVARYADGRFESFGPGDGLSATTVISLGQDRVGYLWVGTVAGLNRFDQGRFTSFFRIDGLPDDLVTSMASSGSRGLLLATPRGLAEHRAGGTKLFNPLNLGTNESFRLLQPGENGTLWFATDRALWRAPLDSSASPSLVHEAAVTAVTPERKGVVWFGTASGELWRFSVDGGGATRVTNLGNRVQTLCVDREGNVWAGTPDGLCRVRKRPLRILEPPEDLTDSAVFSLHESADGALWMAYENGALRAGRDGRYVAPLGTLPFPGSHARTAMVSDASGLWVGTLGEGLFFQKSDGTEHWSQRDGLSDSAVEVVYADKKGGAWVGTRNGGLNYVVDGRIQRFHTPWGFTGHYACAIAEDRRGRLWVGTTGDGLFELSGIALTRHSTTDGLPDNVVRCLSVDDDRLWVGTAAGLATRIDGRWRHLTSRSGLPEDAIDQIQDDGRGNLWIAANQALYRVSKASLLARATGTSLTVEAVPYGRSDGLAEAQFVPGAHARSDAGVGHLYFPSSKGVVMVDTDELEFNRVPPPVLIEQVLIDNESFPPSSGLREGPGSDTVEFRYTAASLTAPEKVRFRCRLEGFDPDWVDMGLSRSARYTKLPPGKYVFTVTACNNDAVWNDTGAQVAFVLQPFWWQTAGFKVVGLVSVCAVAGFLIQSRRARGRELEMLRVRIAGDLHDEIGSSLWSITLLSKMLQSSGTMGDDERKDVGEIHRIAKQTSNSVRDIVWLINPGLDTTQDLVLRMRDFIGATLRNVEAQVRADQADLSRRLSLEFRQNVFLIFKEAITNVARHSNATRVDVFLIEKDGALELRIQDNGNGFSTEQPASGNGLRSLRRRAAKIHGEMVIQSSPGKGTLVSLVARF